MIYVTCFILTIICESLNNTGYSEICKIFLIKCAEIINFSAAFFSLASVIPKMNGVYVDCGVYTCNYTLTLSNRHQSVAVENLRNAKYYIEMMSLETTPEENNSIRLSFD